MEDLASKVLAHAGLKPSALPSSDSPESTGEEDPMLMEAMEEYHRYFSAGDHKKALAALRALKDMM